MTVVAVDSTEPDLDHGRIGRGRYEWIEEQFATPAESARVRPPPPPAAGAGHGPRAEHRLRRGRRDRVPPALAASTSSSPATSTCRTRGGSRTCSSSTRARCPSLRLRGNTRPCYNVIEVDGEHVEVRRRYPYHGEELMIRFSTETLDYVKSTEDDRGGGGTRREGRRRHRRRALCADVVRAALAELPYEFVAARARRRCREAARRGRIRRAAGRRPRCGSSRTSRSSSSTSPTSRCSRRSGGSSSRAARSRSAFATSGRTSTSSRRATSRSALPSLAVIGTGKRIGKTALTGQLARVLSRDRDVVVVAMGRGGPAEPELIEAAPTLDSLLELSRSGRHAASDHLETARLPASGRSAAVAAAEGSPARSRRSNVAEGARLAEELAPDLVVFDGSGAAIPPVATDRRILVTSGGAGRPRRAQRLPRARLRPRRRDRRRRRARSAAIRELEGPSPSFVASFVSSRSSRSTAAWRCSPPGRRRPIISRRTSSRSSANLADRASLRNDLASIDAETYVIEIKAAAIDVVAEAAHGARARASSSRETTSCSLPGEPDLDADARSRSRDAASAERVPA